MYAPNQPVKSGSVVSTNASSGTKRKRQDGPKFYAVRVGAKPGVYYTWNDCLEQVKGFKKAFYKSFSSLTDAERFVAGEDPTLGTAGDGDASKYYAVKSGRKPGIYTDWQSVQEQITGWPKPKHRSFSSRSEAQRFLDEAVPTSPGSLGLPVDFSTLFNTPAPAANTAPTPPRPEVPNQPPPKRVRKTATASKPLRAEYDVTKESDYEPGTGPLPPGSEDGFDPNILLDPRTGNIVYKTQDQRQATKLIAGGNSSTDAIPIFTDGSSFGNGKAGAYAGVGVYFGRGDERNLAEPLAGPRQTNQRAELTAIQRAIEIAPRNRNITIYSDSHYAIQCVTVWCINWRRNGWKNASGKAVENKDLIENVLGKIEQRDRAKVRTDFEWVKGHAGLEGNEQADRLAVEGARKILANT